MPRPKMFTVGLSAADREFLAKLTTTCVAPGLTQAPSWACEAATEWRRVCRAMILRIPQRDPPLRPDRHRDAGLRRVRPRQRRPPLHVVARPPGRVAQHRARLLQRPQIRPRGFRARPQPVTRRRMHL